MGSFIEETTLHFEDDTFKKLRTDADQVLQKLLANMAEKGSLEGKMTITIDVSFTEETVQNRDPNIEGDMRIVHTPKFQHKVGSVLQIKNEQKGGRMYGNEGRCRSCGAKIRFIKMKSGKSMPVNEKIVNYKTDPHGKERIVTPGGDVVACVTGINADEATGFGYVSHFATCPNARNHRR